MLILLEDDYMRVTIKNIHIFCQFSFNFFYKIFIKFVMNNNLQEIPIFV